MNSDAVMQSLKLSELGKLATIERKLVKITGKIDFSSSKTTGQEVLLYSDEQSADDTTFRVEVVVDTELLDDFNVADLNGHHDIVQFIGYKDLTSLSTCEPKECRFKAMNCRIISRTSLASYYYALDTQNAYINRRKQLFN